MVITGKKLAIATWIIAVFGFISQLIHIKYMGAAWLMVQLISILIQCVIGYAMYRDRNDGFTKIVVIIYAFLNFNLSIAILLGLLLCKKYGKKVELVKKCWFVPGLLILLSTISHVILGNSLWYAFTLLTSAAHYLVLGYWLIKYLAIEVKDKKTKEIKAQIDYYTDLHNQGVLTEEEYAKKMAELQN